MVDSMPSSGIRKAPAAIEPAAGEMKAPRRAVAAKVKTTLGERLVVCREARTLSQSEAARAIGITQQSLGNLEIGKSKQPAADTLLDMRDKLGYNPDYVIRGHGMPLLPDFESLALEQSILLIFRSLRPDLRPEALRSMRALRRAQGGPTEDDPFLHDPPGDDD